MTLIQEKRRSISPPICGPCGQIALKNDRPAESYPVNRRPPRVNGTRILFDFSELWVEPFAPIVYAYPLLGLVRQLARQNPSLT